MTYKLLSGLTVIAAAGLLVSCADTFNPGDEGREGRIMADFGLDTEVVTSATSGLSSLKSRAAQEIQVSDLALDLTSADGNIHEHWNSVNDFPNAHLWAVGDYVLEASYGNPDDEGFGKPYYYGKTDVTVRDTQSATVSLTAQLANAMVTVAYSDAFLSYFADFETALITQNGTIDYPADATEPCYVKAADVTLQVKITKNSGTQATLTPKSFTAEPRHHYKLTLDVNGGETGEGELILKFDDMLDLEDEEINLSDALLNAPAPVITPTGFTQGTPVEFTEGTAPKDPRKVTILAQGGISSITMKTKSVSLIEQGWPAETNLAAGNTAELDMLKSLGLTTLGLTKGADKMAVIDFTGVLDHIAYIEGADNTTEFTFEVRDRYSKESEPLTATLVIDKLNLVLSDGIAMATGVNEATFTMTYNGASTDNIVIQYRNDRGTWQNTDATFTLKSRATSAYTVKATVPSTGKAAYVRAKVGSFISNELVINPTPYAMEADARDIFATRGQLTLIDNPDYQPLSRGLAADNAANAELQLSEDGGKTYFTPSATRNGQTWTVTGLKANTTYIARAKVGNEFSLTTSFTTEQALQIPNGNLDADVTIDGHDRHWENVVFQGWGTNNPMTTSKGFDYAYDRISGTKQTDDAKSGKAARISTQGWGTRNTAIGNVGLAAVLEYIDAGLLHLGASRTGRPSGFDGRSGSLETADLDCGIAFGSRPSALSFWYKYEAKNSADHGIARAYVYDAAGNVIASGSLELGSQDSYVKRSVNLTYGAGAAKAAKLYVWFQSTNVPDALTKSSDWITPPPGADLSRGEYSGSRLYIDEVTLDY